MPFSFINRLNIQEFLVTMKPSHDIR